MSIIRQLTQKGDPILHAQLPDAMIQLLEASAKQNKRRRQDQFIKNIAETFKREADFNAAFAKLLPDLKKIYKSNP